MDVNALRAHIEGALEAKRALEAADAAVREVKDLRTRAAERHEREVGALAMLLDGGVAIYGDNLVRVGTSQVWAGNTILLAPIARVPVALSPPALDVPVSPGVATIGVLPTPAGPPTIRDAPFNVPAMIPATGPMPKLSGGVIPPNANAGAARKPGGK